MNNYQFDATCTVFFRGARDGGVIKVSVEVLVWNGMSHPPAQPAEFNEWLHFRVKCARRGEKCADFEREKGHNGKIIACMPRGTGSIKLRRGPIFIALNRNKVLKYHKVLQLILKRFLWRDSSPSK